MYFGPRVKVKTKSTSGTMDLWMVATPETGFQHFADIMSEYDYCPYTVLDANGVDWEDGVGWISDYGGGEWGMSRDYVFFSTNGGNLLDLSTGDHTVILGPPAFLQNGLLAQVHTSIAQPLTTDTWSYVEWSNESNNYIAGTTGGTTSANQALWVDSPSQRNRITQVHYARQMRIHGVIAFNPTSVEPGRYELEITEGYWSVASDTKFHIEISGSTTDVVYLPFDKTMFWPEWMPDYYMIRVVRRGDDTGAGLYTPGCFLHAEVIR